MLSIGSLAAKLFGTSNDRKVKAYRSKVEAINALEPELAKLSDADLKARTEAFRNEMRNGANLSGCGIFRRGQSVIRCRPRRSSQLRGKSSNR